MDNMEQFTQEIQHQVHHAVEEAMGSPVMVNRAVGEAMRHIASFLDMGCAAYLPVRPEEIMVDPLPLTPETGDAVLLITRTMTIEQSFMVIANTKTIEDNRTIDLIAYKQDSFNLHKTKFLQLPKPVGDEIIRQLNQIVKGDGLVMLQCVIAKNFFKNEEVKDPNLFNSDVAAPSEVPPPPPVAPAVPERTPGGLPAVSHETLL